MNMSASLHSPSVTVIIPAFNAVPWLPALFDGLDRQTFRDFEAIFVNDGSIDNTGDLLDAYASSRKWVKVLHQPNGGPGTARNTAVDAAEGEFIVFIDADDTVSPSHLADLFSLATSLDLDVAICNGWRFRDTPGDSMNEPIVVTQMQPERVMSGVEWFETTFNDGEWWGFPWMTIIRRRFIQRHAMRFMDRIANEDITWVAMLQSKAGRVAYTPKQSYYYRWTPGSELNNKSLCGKLRRIYSYIVLIEELWRMAESTEMPRIADLLKRLAALQGRIFLALLAELGSFRLRIAISRDLKKRSFLARLFREVEISLHRKRIVRAYWFAWLGIIAAFLRMGEPASLNLDRCSK
jgi:glycosyltransferase involved in cell wall biosynthesis